MFQTLKNAWQVGEMRKKLIFTAVIIILYRIGCAIPVPFINSEVIQSWFSGVSEGGNIFSYLSVIAGDSFSKATLFALSITPYITASIVIQLLTIALPPLERLSKEGPEGRKKLTNITRYVTVALAFITAFGYYLTIKNKTADIDGATKNALAVDSNWFVAVVIVLTYCAGASIIMWLGEKINNHGIGNGISMILFANILSGWPGMFSNIYSVATQGKVASVVIVGVIMCVLIYGIVGFTNSERRLPVQYAKRQVGRRIYGGNSTYLPMKLNMGGVMPIIFAQSIVALPSTLGLIFGWDTTSGFFKYVSMSSPIGVTINFILIILFSYFYLAISFNPVDVANNLKNNGGVVLGHRPGKPTSDYITKILNRITLLGGLFLGFISVFPSVLYWIFPNSVIGQLVFGGSSLLIVVGVILETARDIESQITMRHYKGFLEY